MKKVFICSPLRGDYENNIQRAREYSLAAVKKGCIPITPHIFFTQFMADNVPSERKLAMEMGLELLLKCDELWAFGIDHPSEGMAREIEAARDAGIPVLNGFKTAYSIEAPGPAPKEDELPYIGSVTFHVPRTPVHPAFEFKLAGVDIIELADMLRADPDADIEVEGNAYSRMSGGGRDGE